MSPIVGSNPSSLTGAQRGYSATVELWLELDSRRVPLAQVGASRIYFDNPVEFPAAVATLITVVAGTEDPGSAGPHNHPIARGLLRASGAKSMPMTASGQGS